MSERQRPSIPKAAPWLVFPHGKGRKFRVFIILVNTMGGKAYYHKPSHQGWLIVIGGVDANTDQYCMANSNLNDCFLWNLVSLETIQLPNLDRQSFPPKSKDYFLYDLVLSSPPLQSTTSDPDNLGCMIYLLFKHHPKIREEKQVLAFCRPADKQWRRKVFPCFALKASYTHSVMHPLIQIKIHKLWHRVEDNNQSNCFKIIKLKHADFTWIGGGEEFTNEIFKVHLNCSPRGFKKVTSTHIFKLDFSSMTWVLLKSLGDHVLFLKCYLISTSCCSAADMGLERGLEDNAATVIMPCLKLPTPWFLPTWIMMPTTENRHVAGRRKRITDLLVSQDTSETSIEEENISRLNSGGEELEVLEQWDFLDDYDSTEAIASFLHPVDYIHFRVACKQNSIFLPALNRLSASTRTTATTCLSPWLISIFEENKKTICDILVPMDNNDRYIMKFSRSRKLVGATIRFSKDGWLLLSNGKKTVFCYNPFTRAIIRLPDLPDDYVLGGMSFSSILTSRNCVVIAISNWT
ncbi:hypothetical protein MKX01_012283 [Papaver californicum]|nr:hypothetical protein MKX01_012283 [Papaver californicum]